MIPIGKCELTLDIEVFKRVVREGMKDFFSPEQFNCMDVENVGFTHAAGQITGVCVRISQSSTPSRKSKSQGRMLDVEDPEEAPGSD